MIIKSAEINQDGVMMLEKLAQIPQILEDDFKPEFDQLYIPGISVPTIDLLQKPFNVPIFGDNESIYLGIDYPRKQNVGFYKRIKFIGMLAAEEITVGWPLTQLDDDASGLSFFDEYDPQHYDDEMEDALDEYTGEWGGFLHTSAEFVLRNVTDGGVPMYEVVAKYAEFVVMEDESDCDTVHKLLESGNTNAADIVSAVRMPQLGKLLFK